MKRSKRFLPFWAVYSLLLAGFSLPCYSADAVDLDQVRAWCQGKTPEQLTLKLIWFAEKFNKLDNLYQMDKADWTKTSAEVNGDLETARSSLTRLEQGFDAMILTQAERRILINQERCLWRGGLLSLAGSWIGTIFGGIKGAAIGAGIGAAGGATWWIVEEPP